MFSLALDGWPKRNDLWQSVIYCILSFILKMCPSHLNLSLSIDLKSEHNPIFSTAYCLKSGQLIGFPKLFIILSSLSLTLQPPYFENSFLTLTASDTFLFLILLALSQLLLAK